MPRLQSTLVRRVVVAALFVVGALAFVSSWAISSPIGSTVDDDFHLASIWCPNPGTADCPVRTNDAGRPELQVPSNLVYSQDCTFGQFDNSGACTTELTTEPTWRTRFNDGQYLGTFYQVLHPLAGEPDFASVAAIRIANGVIGIVAIGLAAYALPRSGRRLLALATLPIAAPYIIELVASVNPSSWSFTGIVAAWFGAWAAVRAETRHQRVIGIVASALGAVMAILARADSAAYVGVIAACFVLLHARSFYKTRAFKMALAGVGLIVVAAAVVFIASGNTSVLRGGFRGYADLPESSLPPGLNLFIQNVMNVPLNLTEFSVFNLDHTTPPIVSATLVLAVGGLVFAGLRRTSALKLVVGGGLFLLMGGLIVFVAQMGGNPVPGPVQSRYVLPLLPIVLAIVLWRPSKDGALTLTRTQAWALAIGIVMAHTISLHTFIRRWVTGLDVFELNLSHGAEWWGVGPSPMWTWIIGSVGFAVLASSIVLLRRDPEPVARHAATSAMTR